jgi:dienelactone hydrolase
LIVAYGGYMQRHIIQKEQVADIPILTIAPEGAINCPVVFFIHGFRGTKADGVHLGYQLASAGIICVCVDAFMHGERLDDRLMQVSDPTYPHVYPVASTLDRKVLLLQIVVQTAADIEELIRAFATDERIDLNRMGVTGESMGGMVTFYLAARQPCVQVAVPVISVPNFARYWEDAVLQASTNAVWANAIGAVQETLDKHTALYRQNDPMEQLAAFAPKPLLMLQGDKDTTAYKFGPMELYRQLLPAYRDHRERLQLHLYPDTDHRVTQDMVIATCQWFCQYLR